MERMSKNVALSESCAVVCPIYRKLTDSLEIFSLINNRYQLSVYKWFFIGPESLRSYAKEIEETLGLRDIFFESFSEKYFSGIGGYNKLCKSKALYTRFRDFSYILICQLDCLVFAKKLDAWMSDGKSFYGALLNRGYTEAIRDSLVECRNGRNGGLSLRKVEDFLSCLEENRWIPLTAYRGVCLDGASVLYRLKTYVSWLVASWTKGPLQARLNEDVFWTVCIPHVFSTIFRVADRKTSSLFSIEMLSTERLEIMMRDKKEVPFGCHGWVRYDYEDWIELIAKHRLVDSRCTSLFYVGREGIRLKADVHAVKRLLELDATVESKK